MAENVADSVNEWVEPAPCALCGSDSRWDGCSVRCRGCGLSLPERGDEDYFDVVRRWNSLMVRQDALKWVDDG